jgi:hypothetical protein
MTVDVFGSSRTVRGFGARATERQQLAVGATAAAAVAAAVIFLLAPPMGIDLAAQVAYADFWVRHGGAVLDFGWYGGVSPYGYSVLAPPLIAGLGGGVTGTRWVGALAAVVSSMVLLLLLLRTGAKRPLLAGLLGVVGMFGNLVTGRVTFLVGLVCGLSALLALTSGRPWLRRVGGTGAAAAAAMTSPVAGLFVGLAGTALALSYGWRRTTGTVLGLDGLLVAVGAGVPMVAMAVLFGANGPMNVIYADIQRAAGVSLVVAVFVSHRPVRVGALLSAAGVLATAVVTTPVGLNAGRLSATFALPVLCGYAERPSWLRLPPAMMHPAAGRAGLAVLLLVVAAWQHPVAVKELRDAGHPTASDDYFRPLLAELGRRGPVGRVEVVPTAKYWEAAYVPGSVPIARGWLRQADTQRNPIFFDGNLTGDRYGHWLRNNGVSLVALSTAPAASVGRREARLIRAGQPYLKRAWRGGGWTLYTVEGAPSLVSGAAMVRSTDLGVALDAPSTGDVLVRLRWSRWLAVHGPEACLIRRTDGWTTVRVSSPGRYTITGSFRPGPRC